ncbi:MAG: hydrogenase maturation nickel metallochaperone HypA [Alphaproteobacteria bacterium]|nr:hydrogenase maturation nickel metallochaperone HypA [Alphaproteobacteria bacterium]
MHELSLCEHIRDMLEEKVRTDGFAHVNRVWLEMGPFSCVDPEALRFAFAIAMHGTVVENATLQIDTVPAEARCLACDKEATMTQLGDPCPHCGETALHTVGGDDLRVSRIEVV